MYVCVSIVITQEDSLEHLPTMFKPSKSDPSIVSKQAFSGSSICIRINYYTVTDFSLTSTSQSKGMEAKANSVAKSKSKWNAKSPSWQRWAWHWTLLTSCCFTARQVASHSCTRCNALQECASQHSMHLSHLNPFEHSKSNLRLFLQTKCIALTDTNVSCLIKCSFPLWYWECDCLGLPG